MNSIGGGCSDGPDPARAESLAEFVSELSLLRIRAGESYKSLQQRIGVPHSTLCDTLTGKRRPRREVIEKVVRAYARDDTQVVRWLEVWDLIVVGGRDGSAKTSLVPMERALPLVVDERWELVSEPVRTRRPARLRSILIWCSVAVVAIMVDRSTAGLVWPGDRDPSPTAQAQIDRQLLQVSGGEEISRHEVSYSDGNFVVGFSDPGHRDTSATDCPRGWICFYERRGYGWPRARLTACGWTDLGWWEWNDRVESVRNNTGSALEFINHDDHFNPADGHRFDKRLFRMIPYQQLTAVPGTAKPPDQADYVIRSCAK
jgi:hypothetical protein